MLVVVYIYHIAVNHVTIHNLAGVFMMLLLAWFSGIGIGMVFYALKPWFPQFATVGSTIYARANMIASGKMFVANTVPWNIIVLFSWNPLFTSSTNAGVHVHQLQPALLELALSLIVSTVLLVIGFMGESYTRKHASLSWSARR